RRRREALSNQSAAEERAWPEEKKAASLAIEEATARQREAEATAKFAEGEASRLKRLREQGLTSQSDLERAESEAQKQRAAASALGLTAARLESEASSKEKNRQVHVAQLQRDAAALDGELGTLEATIKRVEFVIEQRRIRAPIAGEVGEIAQLPAGSFVTEGQRIGAIIPAGEL